MKICFRFLRTVELGLILLLVAVVCIGGQMPRQQWRYMTRRIPNLRRIAVTVLQGVSYVNPDTATIVGAVGLGGTILHTTTGAE